MAHDTELFLDDRFIEMSGGVTRRINRPSKYPFNPVLKPESWWEGRLLQATCALYDPEDKLFKLWLRAGRGFRNDPLIDGHELFTTYAVSRDGIHWDRPQPGVLELAGRRDHGVVLTGGVYPRLARQGKKGWIEGVIKHPAPRSPDEKFVCMYYDMKARGTYLAFSPDGVRWNKTDQPFWQTPVDVTDWGDDGVNSMIYDRLKKKWVVYRRVIPQESERLTAVAEDENWKMPDRIMRVMGYAESDDLKEWKNHRIILAPDADDDPDVEFYGLSVYVYEQVYIGYLWVFHMDPNRSSIDIQLVTSRDGVNFTRCCRRETFLPSGPRGYFDYQVCMNYQSEPVVVNDTIYFYYTASNFDHYDGFLRKDAMASVGLATSPRDRFVCLESGLPEPCRLVTRPLVVKEPKLFLNAATWGGGAIRTEILTRDWKPVAGFESSAAEPVRGNNLAHRVRWKENADLGALAGREIRLKFDLVDARLYAVTFSDEERESAPLPELRVPSSFSAEHPVEV